MPIAILVTLT
jgi:hypothetical protein